ncbi:MAG TPA: PKD domain-containing protein, partial [Chitinispirillaceae bacterium]|nr:PKD domain-containing protein [Chitinispirillaceae bacterium]
MNPDSNYLPNILLSTIIFALLSVCIFMTCDSTQPVQFTGINEFQTARVKGSSPSIGGYHVYYGDLHNHSSVDDNHGQGSSEQAYTHAKNVANYDFLGLASHDMYITDDEWKAIGAAADAATINDTFIAFRGFEWTTNELGHIAIINSSDYCKSAQSPTNTFEGICSWISARAGSGCVAFFNHPGRQNSTGKEFGHFATNPVSNMVGIELWNKTDAFSDYYYNDGYYQNDNNKSFFDEANSRGWKLGAAGAGDNHGATWGTAAPYRLAVLADALTRNDIISALQACRFYSTLDSNLVLSFKLGSHEMGSSIDRGKYDITILAEDGNHETFTEVVIFDGSHNVIRSWNPNTSSVTITDTLSAINGNYYYIKIKQADGSEAVSSPIWINNGPPPPTCTITMPVHNATFDEPASITINAAAIASGSGSITSVQFFANNNLIGDVSTSPYTMIWNNVPSGTYYLIATATDNEGTSSSSDPVSITVKPSQNFFSVDRPVASGSDDAEEHLTDHTVDAQSSDLELTKDSTSHSNYDQIVGIRFTGCAIPYRAIISQAWIQFTCDETSNKATIDTIYGEFIDNSESFVHQSNGTISSRPKTFAYVNWDIPAWNTLNEAGIAHRTPDLSAVIQEIVNRSGFNSSSAITFLVIGKGTRIAYSYEGGSSRAAILHVEYTPYVNQPPIAVLTTTITSGDAPLNVAFDGTSSSDADNDALSFSWNFGDGTILTDAGATLSHVYAVPGSYTATLSVDDGKGHIDNKSVEIDVWQPQLPPVAILIATPTSGDAPLYVSFDGSGSSDPNNDALSFSWDFGDGNTSTGIVSTSSHVYTTPGSYTAILTVSDGRGGTDNESVIITVIQPQRPPVASFTATPTNGDAPLNVEFDGAASSDPDSDPLSFAWDFGDGKTEVGSTVSHVYSIPGNYTATLTVEDGNGNSDSKSVLITVTQPQRPPVASFTATPSSGDAPLDVEFDGTASSDPDGDPLSFAWNFGDEKTGTGSTVSHVYSTPGNYTATLTVDDGNGNSDSKSVLITVTQPQRPPVASFTATPSSGDAPLNVEFDRTASSDPDSDPLSFAWDFGDGNTGTGSTVLHVYSTPGTYTVILTVEDDNGNSDSKSVLITVTQPQRPPVASFTANPTSGDAPLNVEFDGTASSDPDSDPLSFAWDFGDGKTGTGSIASHVYTTPGTYTAVLVVNDGYGNSDSKSVLITVTQPQRPPVVSFTANPTSGDAPLNVEFDGAASSDPDSDPLSFTWNFGDGKTGTGSIASHVYSTPGTCTVTLRVDDGNGNSDSESIIITVTQPQRPPYASFTATPTSGDAPLNIEFDGTASSDPDSDPLSFTWNFGDEKTGTGSTVSHVYSTPGTYTVTLTVEDGNGNSDSKSVLITVTQPQRPPVASFTANPTGGDAPLNVEFDGTASSDPDGDPLSFAWNFGDEKTGTGSTVSHVYSTPGTYTVTLTVEDGNGNSDSKSIIITVTQPQRPPVAAFSANPSSGDAPLNVEFDGTASSDPDSDSLTYAWNFGDEQTGAGSNLSHVFAAPGSYTTTLIINDGHGNTDSKSVVITVTQPQRAPVAAFSANPTIGIAPLIVTFDGLSSYDADNDKLTFSWNFGDGIHDTGSIVSHVYMNSGLYNAILTVTDEYGNADSHSIEIIVDYKTSIHTVHSTVPTFNQPNSITESHNNLDRKAVHSGI